MEDTPARQGNTKPVVQRDGDNPPRSPAKRKKLSGGLRLEVGNRIMLVSRGLPDETEPRVIEQLFKSRFPGLFDGWSSVTVSEAARHRQIRRVLRTERSPSGRRGAVELHSREMAEQYYGHPEAIIEETKIIRRTIDETKLDYARSHLEAYPSIRQARVAYHRASSLGGKLRESLHRELLDRVRDVISTLYPGIAEYSSGGPGPTPEQFVVPELMARDARLEIEELGSGQSSFGPVIKARQKDDRWRVSRTGVTTYAMLAQESQCRADELTSALGKLARDRGLQGKFKETKAIGKKVSALREKCISEVRDQGARIQHGEPIAGTCPLGY